MHSKCLGDSKAVNDFGDIVRSKRIIIIVATITAVVFGISPSISIAEDITGDGLRLTPDAVVDLLLERSFGLKQAEMTRDAVAEDIPTAKSVFDTTLGLDASYQLDKSASESSIFGDRTDTANWGLSLSKEIPSGTALGLSLTNVRRKTYNSTVGNVQIIPDQALYEPVLGFSLTQPFMQNAFGVNDRRAVAQAKFAYASADFTLKRETDLLVHKGLINYWALVFIKKHIQAQERAVAFAREFFETTKEEKKLGTAEKTDLLAAEANLLSRKDELLALREMERTTSEELRRDLEFEPEVGLNPPLNWPEFTNAGIFDDERIKAAFERRGDYQSLRSDLERQNVRLAVAKNVRWPSLDLVSTLELNDVDPSYQTAIGNMDSPNWTVGLSFSVPLENRAARADARRTTAEKARALFALKDIENQIVNELSRLIEEVKARKEIVDTSRRTLELQVAKLKEEMKKYHMGRSSSYVMVQYQNDAVMAERHLVEAWFAYQESVLGLKLADGTIVWDDLVKAGE